MQTEDDKWRSEYVGQKLPKILSVVQHHCVEQDNECCTVHMI
jgi:hypothetical protein